MSLTQLCLRQRKAHTKVGAGNRGVCVARENVNKRVQERHTGMNIRLWIANGQSSHIPTSVRNETAENGLETLTVHAKKKVRG